MVFISQRNELRGFQEEKFRGVKIDLHGGGKKVTDRIKWEILLIQSVVSLVINRIIGYSKSTIANAFQPHEYMTLRKYSVVVARIKHYLESLKLSASTQILKYVIRTMIF